MYIYLYCAYGSSHVMMCYRPVEEGLKKKLELLIQLPMALPLLVPIAYLRLSMPLTYAKPRLKPPMCWAPLSLHPMGGGMSLANVMGSRKCK